MERTLKEARIDAGLTVQEAVNLLEVPRRTWEDWEAGRRHPAPWAEKLLVKELNRVSKKDL